MPVSVNSGRLHGSSSSAVKFFFISPFRWSSTSITDSALSWLVFIPLSVRKSPFEVNCQHNPRQIKDYMLKSLNKQSEHNCTYIAGIIFRLSLMFHNFSSFFLEEDVAVNAGTQWVTENRMFSGNIMNGPRESFNSTLFDWLITSSYHVLGPWYFKSKCMTKAWIWEIGKEFVLVACLSVHVIFASDYRCLYFWITLNFIKYLYWSLHSNFH